MLTIERVHLRQPVEEPRVIRERHASLRPGDEEARRIHRGQCPLIVAHRERRVIRKELLDRHSPILAARGVTPDRSRASTADSMAPGRGGHVMRTVSAFAMAAVIAVGCGVFAQSAAPRTTAPSKEWPTYGHDP